MTNPEALKLPQLTYLEALQRRLQVIDAQRFPSVWKISYLLLYLISKNLGVFGLSWKVSMSGLL